MAAVGKSLRGRGGRGSRGRGRSSNSSFSHPYSSSSPASVSCVPRRIVNQPPAVVSSSNANREVRRSIPPPAPEPEINEDEQEYEEAADEAAPAQQEDPQLNMTMQQLLEMPGRDMYLTRLDPNPVPGTIWFDRDNGVLAGTISRILKRKFDGPYYSWSKTPQRKQDAYYIDFARAYNWEYSLDHEVRNQFDKVCGRRMKGMVNQVKGKGQPNWIGNDIWAEMNAYWETDDAQSRSSTASTARNSTRGGLGIHKHVAGQKSFIRVQQELEEEKGRHVSLGEVFIKTHTRADGTYVDMKAQQISEAYDKSVSDKLSQIVNTGGEETSETREISTEELNTIFLESSIRNRRGVPNGLGSLSQVYGKAGRATSSSNITTVGALHKELEAARRMIDDEKQRHQATMSKLDSVINWIQLRDPHYQPQTDE